MDHGGGRKPRRALRVACALRRISIFDVHHLNRLTAKRYIIQFSSYSLFWLSAIRVAVAVHRLHAASDQTAEGALGLNLPRHLERNLARHRPSHTCSTFIMYPGRSCFVLHLLKSLPLSLCPLATSLCRCAAINTDGLHRLCAQRIPAYYCFEATDLLTL